MVIKSSKSVHPNESSLRLSPPMMRFLVTSFLIMLFLVTQFTIDNTPPQYIKEIIVVDDQSAIPLADVLDAELPASYRKKVKVFRFEKKQGLIRSRIYGADHSTGSNIVSKWSWLMIVNL